jgi:hypothetical protein
MWKRLGFWLPGMALVVGGVVSGTCHLFNFESPTDLAHIAQYPALGALLHLVLFAGALLALAGWIGRFAVRQSGANSITLAALICLFTGILCGDLLHSILEFSVFPVVDQMAPYALPGLADATYRSMPVFFLLIAGRMLLVTGAAAFALATYREPCLPRWPAIPFAFSAALEAVAIIPGSNESLRSFALAAMYFSMAALGLSLFLHDCPPISAPSRARSRIATSLRDSQPRAR